MTTILDEERVNIIDHNGSARLTIPAKWRGLLNLEAEQEENIALVNGKHGLFLAVWADNQPQLEDIEEDEL